MSTAAAQLGDSARALLRQGPLPARELMAALQVSQPTLSRALRTLGDELLPFGAARSIQYALRDPSRQALQAPVYRVSAEGRLAELGTLVPVHAAGFVMCRSDGSRAHTEGLPWWLYDMRPQGYLGRAYNLQYGAQLGLPARLEDWSDSHVLHALLLQGSDLPGNLLVGEAARQRFVDMGVPQPVAIDDKPRAYAERAAAAARGEHPGSSAGGEQPKFAAYAETPDGPAHVLVKFTALTEGPVSARWRDLLQAEHLALEVLHEHGMAAARSTLCDHGGQRFLEVRRFDRDGPLGRRALFSVAALDAEFVGIGSHWPRMVRALAAAGVVAREAVAPTEALWAFGMLIANTDMHGGNLSFMSEQGRPYQLAPAYDMTCMAFAPTGGGDLPDREIPLAISAEVPAAAWHRGLAMARRFLARLEARGGWSEGFRPCRERLVARIAQAGERIGRLAPEAG